MSAGQPAAHTSRAWIALVLVVGAVACVAIARWVWAVAQHAPVLYGEGAVAHAAILARQGAAYAEPTGGALFVAANYTPLYFTLASAGDPFVTGRVLSIAAALFVAAAIAWRARRGGMLVALALAATWVAAAPVAVWGPVLKPDLLAVALAVASVLALDARRVVLAGMLVALAAWAKPTEVVTAVALLLYLARSERRALAPFVLAGGAGLAVAAALTHLPDAALYQHVVSWNALGWSAGQLALLVVLAVMVAGANIAAPALLRVPGPASAYAIGAAGIVVLGGREGATFNYLLDLIAASALALATVAPRLRAGPAYPVAAIAQAVLAVALLDPIGVLPGHAITTGAWSPPGRVDVVARIEGDLLVEDAGLLVASGRTPAVDDLFLWSRLRDRGLVDARVIDAVRAARFAAVVSEVELARLDSAPLYERQRWHPDLAAAVLDRYSFARVDGGLFVYLPR